MLTKNREDILICVGLVFIAGCVCMASPLNPFSGIDPGIDSSVFMTIAQGMLRGKTPYIDFFDHKGPLIYFIDAAGLALGGFTGVYLIELFFMCVSIIFAYKTARFFGGKLAAFFGTGLSFCILCSLFKGNYTEEYALPFIFISLYLFVKYYFTGIELKKIQIFVTGACFGCSLLLRPNMFAVWASFCIVIFVQKMARKEYLLSFRYALFFLLGLVAVLSPVFAYLAVTQSLDECIWQYIGFNFIYTTSSSARTSATFFNFAKYVYIFINKSSVIPLIVSLVLLFRKPAGMKTGFCIAYALAIVLSLFFTAMSRRNYIRYCMVLIPLFVPAFTICMSCLFRLFSSAKHVYVKYGVPVLVMCVFLNPQMVGMAKSVYSVIHSNTKSRLQQIGEFIYANTKDDDAITVFGNMSVLYLYSGRESASKYIYQFPLITYRTEILDEYIYDLKRTKPALIIVTRYVARLQECCPSLYSMLENEYTECFNTPEGEKYPIVIFKRKQTEL
ncbi:MAG: hypothetical protein LBG92_03590 [Prevotellaceae bacterium]|nr:hypothetical protein [Prevotellaceae bacterium]